MGRLWEEVVEYIDCRIQSQKVRKEGGMASCALTRRLEYATLLQGQLALQEPLKVFTTTNYMGLSK